MSLTVARIAAHLFNTPLLLMPETAVAIASNLADRFGVEPMADAEPVVIEASRFRGAPAAAGPSGRPMYRAENGVAVIPVLGELVNRGAWIGASSGLTSYEGLDAQLRAAAADPEISGIVLDLNSPGGEATGAMETGALVRSIAAKKPVVAFVNGMAASAGYAIAAGATTIVSTPTGAIGSIGVVMLHLDRSAALAKAGVKPTLIHAGKYKVDGNSTQALPEEARARIQKAIDGFYAMFVSHVARMRKVDPAAIMATEGALLLGQDAVAAGLADKLGDFDDALKLAAKAKGKPTSAAPVTPAHSTPAGDPNLPEEPFLLSASRYGGHLAADVATRLAGPGPYAIADCEAELTAMRAENADLLAAVAVAEEEARTAVLAARQRAMSILALPAAEGRAMLAHYLVFETEMTLDEAAQMLAVSAKSPLEATGVKSRPRLTVINPNLSPDGGPPVASTSDASWDAVIDHVSAEAGFKPQRKG